VERNLGPRKYTEIHGRIDEDKIVMATESTEEHGKNNIKSICHGNTLKNKSSMFTNQSV
jgi:hypothetical protein